MARCKNDALLSMIGSKKLQKETETEFVRHNYLPDCRRLVANNYVNTVSGAVYDKWAVPKNQFECMRDGCVNSGTLTLDGTAAPIYKLPWSAIDYANGVITMYVKGDQGTTIEVSVSSDISMENADTYTVTIGNDVPPASLDTYVPIVIDLSKTPTTVVGEGWDANPYGAYLRVKTPASKTTGISSIAIFDSLEDFEITATVVLSCLSQLGGSWDFEAVEATCFGNGGIDDEGIDNIEKTLTAKAMTPNYHLLNPLYSKGENTVGFDMVTVQKVVEPESDGDPAYGMISLADAFSEECGFISVARADNCNVSDAHLTELKVPAYVDVDEGHFIAIRAEGEIHIIVNKALIGQTLIIRYPQAVDVEEFVYDVDAVRDTRWRWSYTRTYTDGTKYRFTFDNVIITSFPDEITDEEGEFEFTIAIQKDALGRFGRAQKIGTTHIYA